MDRRWVGVRWQRGSSPRALAGLGAVVGSSKTGGLWVTKGSSSASSFRVFQDAEIREAVGSQGQRALWTQGTGCWVDGKKWVGQGGDPGRVRGEADASSPPEQEWKGLGSNAELERLRAESG